MFINICFRGEKCFGFFSTISAGESWTLPKIFLLFHGVTRSLWKGHSFLQLLNVFVAGRPNPNKCVIPYLLWVLAVLIGLMLALTQAGFPNNENFTKFSTINMKSKINTVFGLLLVFITFIKNVVGYIEEFMLSIVIFTVWKIVSSFVANFNQSACSENLSNFLWEKIKQEYSKIICITDVANDIIWPNIVGHTIKSFVYYSFNFSEFMESKDCVYRLGFIIYILNTCCFYYFGADVSSQV